LNFHKFSFQFAGREPGMGEGVCPAFYRGSESSERGADIPCLTVGLLFWNLKSVEAPCTRTKEGISVFQPP